MFSTECLSADMMMRNKEKPFSVAFYVLFSPAVTYNIHQIRLYVYKNIHG